MAAYKVKCITFCVRTANHSAQLAFFIFSRLFGPPPALRLLQHFMLSKETASKITANDSARLIFIFYAEVTGVGYGILPKAQIINRDIV